MDAVAGEGNRGTVDSHGMRASEGGVYHQSLVGEAATHPQNVTELVHRNTVEVVLIGRDVVAGIHGRIDKKGVVLVEGHGCHPGLEGVAIVPSVQHRGEVGGHAQSGLAGSGLSQCVAAGIVDRCHAQEDHQVIDGIGHGEVASARIHVLRIPGANVGASGHGREIRGNELLPGSRSRAQNQSLVAGHGLGGVVAVVEDDLEALAGAKVGHVHQGRICADRWHGWNEHPASSVPCARIRLRQVAVAGSIRCGQRARVGRTDCISDKGVGRALGQPSIDGDRCCIRLGPSGARSP